MGKSRNDFIKQHQRGRWRYLSLLAQSVDTHFPAYAQFHKKHFKNSPHFIYFLGHTLGNARQHTFS